MDETNCTINGIIFKHGEDDYSLWNGFSLTKEEENAIMEILNKHVHDGGSERGTRQQIAKAMT